MLINIHCAKCVGIDAVDVTVEVDLGTGIGIHLVGLADIGFQDTWQEDSDKSCTRRHTQERQRI